MLHFELSPANRRRLEAYLADHNEDPERVTPRLKVGDVVNRALDLWLSRRGMTGERNHAEGIR